VTTGATSTPRGELVIARWLGIAAVAILVPTMLGASAEPSLARLTDAATSTNAISTDTLDPPTGLAATGGTTAALSWTATTDAYATGYEVQRATVSGGPYALVSTVTPRTVVSTTDAPSVSGTYYYVLRSYFQNWTSVDSNQASAVISLTTTSTGFKACTTTSNAADTGGDGNGYETTATNACATDGSVATDASTGTNTTVSCTDAGKDRHRFWDFGLGMPATVSSVGGIQVRADVGLNNNSGTSEICAQLSWDAGTTWTAAKSIAVLNVAVTTYALGAANDTWGRTWLGSEFSNANFRVRLIDLSDRTTKDFRLDGLAVQVTYTP
jgi:hypothetical protein